MPEHLREQLEKIRAAAAKKLAAIHTAAELAEYEMKLFGRKKGELTKLLKGLKELGEEAKKTLGQLANEVKQEMEAGLAARQKELTAVEINKSVIEEKIDITQPALPKREYGHSHPNTLVQEDLEDFFVSLGFMVIDGPEIDSDYYNFTAVNVPPAHPARDSQDTFYIKDHPEWVMRTQTSSVQVRAMQKYGAPLRAIVPGKCFRNEATDVRHEHTFYQIEGVVIDRAITFGHLKGVLQETVKHLYGSDAKLRLRPKYYPFVEPGVNGEVTCFLCKGSGCRVCKKSGWLEILGAGMIHPHVLKVGGIDPTLFQGFAFGLGLTRLAMLKYGIDDVRLLESGDMRFLRQF